MKHSVHARRMARRHGRQQVARLNLVSLMDIFTILVFFLLVNSSDVEVLQSDKSLKLPDSVSSQRPNTNLIILVNADDILVGGRVVAKVTDLEGEDAVIAGLKQELVYQMRNAAPLSEAEQLEGRDITIMGDKQLPYKLLKRIMATCAETEYRNISLAVNQVYRDAMPVSEG